jgi:hypothetical protein
MDDSIEYGVNMSKLIDEINSKSPVDADETTSELEIQREN